MVYSNRGDNLKQEYSIKVGTQKRLHYIENINFVTLDTNIINIKLYDEEDNIIHLTDSKVKINYEDEQGKKYYQDEDSGCIIKDAVNGLIQVTINNGIFSNQGKIKAEIVIKSDKDRITTNQFTFNSRIPIDIDGEAVKPQEIILWTEKIEEIEENIKGIKSKTDKIKVKSGNNYFIGNVAGEFATGGMNNIGIGFQALTFNERGSNNTAMGSDSLSANRTGANNIAVGYGSLRGNIRGNDNIGLGFQVLSKNTLGFSNIGIGYKSLWSNTTGQDNISIGASALKYNTTGSNNIGIGRDSLNCVEETSRNIGIGKESLGSCYYGSDNIGIGYQCLYYIEDGSDNIALGDYSSLYTIEGNDVISYNNSIAIGTKTYLSSSDQVRLGNTNNTVYTYGSVHNRADERDIADLEDTKLGLDFILGLKPRQFKFNYREDYIQLDENGHITKLQKDGSKKRNRIHQGFSGQEIKQLLEDKRIDFGGYQDHSINGGEDVLTIGYAEFIAPLVKAVQEQQWIIDGLFHKIEAIEKLI